jgi:hypothetical protein
MEIGSYKAHGVEKMPKTREQLIVCMFIMMCKLSFLHDVVVHVCGNHVQVLPIDDFLSFAVLMKLPAIMLRKN